MLKTFVMSPAEFESFTKACTAPTVLVMEAGEVKQLDRFAKVEAFWRAMGTLHGFIWDTARPVEGAHIAFYEAEPTNAPNQFGDYGDAYPLALS